MVTGYMIPHERNPMNIQKIAVRAVVTFFQVAISVLIGSGVLDVSASVFEKKFIPPSGSAVARPVVSRKGGARKAKGN